MKENIGKQDLRHFSSYLPN